MSESITPLESNCTEPAWTYRGYRLDGGNFTTAMVHLYRAEVTRANLWRSRLDTTTNWAVITTAAALTFSFSSAHNPHFVLLLVLLLVLSFLGIEARRYTYYALWYHRVRLMETDFFAAMVAPPFQPSADWGDALRDTLIHPAFPISGWEALGSRYRRIYVWLVTLLLISWWIKLSIHPEPVQGVLQIVQRAAVGPAISGAWVIGAVGVTYVALLAITLVTMQRQELRGAGVRTTKQARGPREPRVRRKPRLAVIITNDKEALAARLLQELGRGVTALDGVGMYTGDSRDVLLCAVTDVQVEHLETIIQEIDPQAFVVVVEASAVHGTGFRPFEPPS
ncbi:MAG TPA: DUF2270 domain-containing protein [Anaerolineae bacterium]|nr:DUF2270 domain-containing protein [Anaerolineae bacterium]